MKKYSEPSANVLLFACEDILSFSTEVEEVLTSITMEDGGNFGDFNMFS